MSFTEISNKIKLYKSINIAYENELKSLREQLQSDTLEYINIKRTLNRCDTVREIIRRNEKEIDKLKDLLHV